MKLSFTDLGTIDYQKAWDYQKEIFNTVWRDKEYNSKNSEQKRETTHHLIFCEHPHVYTLGKSGAESNLLINDQFLKKVNATYYKTDRGGDITYHGPGQIVGYPIFNLEELNIGLKEYIYQLEEVVIDTLKEYNIKSERLAKATGVWIDTDKPNARKICAIGVKASRYISMHGFALNVNTNLSYFDYINPCGFTDKLVTSMEKELNGKVAQNEVSSLLLKNIERVFKL
ncbi:lipoyl(octanoyl) transferase LipB [Marinilabiliaceae bacterium ANBcel2]|nr:lipoyl(octanoyl) transferase LipB [Marinilabiliaceae bacterium ANBcel2]